MKISKTKRRRGLNRPAHLEWAELYSIYRWARSQEDQRGELSEPTQLGYLARDLRS